MDKRVVRVDPHGKLIHYNSTKWRPISYSVLQVGEKVSVALQSGQLLVWGSTVYPEVWVEEAHAHR